MNNHKKYLIVFVIALFIFRIVQNSKAYIRPYDHTEVGKIYSESQYVIGEKSENGIGDDGLYAFSGYYYLVQGGDPSAVNFEHPPLGKYLIGLSIFLFGNENIISLIYGSIFLAVLFLTAKRMTNNFYVSVSAVIVALFDPFITSTFHKTLLDLPLMLFFLSGVYFFLKAKGRNRWYIISSTLFGIAFTVKFFPSLVLLLPVLGFTLIKNKKRFFQWLISLVIIPVVYLVSYSVYFVYHPSIIEFIRFQKWVIDWRLGNPVVFGNIWRTILTGSYTNWWDGGSVVSSDWTLHLPIIVVGGLLGGVIAIKRKHADLLFLFSISAVFLLYVSVATVGVAAYIMPIYPLLIVLFVSFIAQVARSIIGQWSVKKSRQ